MLFRSVILGDFNENPDEYELVGGAYPTALRSSADGYGPWLSLYSDNPEALPENSFFCPWEDTGGYSYVYEGRRERIDSILMSPGAAAGPSFKYHSFSAEPPAFLLNAAGEPIRWSATAQDGYSDHLPITLRLRPLP